MDVFRPQATLERSNTDRPSVEIGDVANRRAKAVSHDGNSKSFLEVAGLVATNPRRDARVQSDLNPPQPEKTFKLWENSKMGFGDLVDIINPLQHLPIAATIYRNRTGDGIGFAPRVIGGALWGRVGGFVSGIVNALVNSLTGKDIGDHIYSALFGASGNSRGAGTKAMAAALPLQFPKNQGIMAQPLSDASETMQSAFGDFDDDGGFYVTGRSAKLAESLASRSISSASSDAVAALSSYEQNVDLDESKESFRFRFPA